MNTINRLSNRFLLAIFILVFFINNSLAQNTFRGVVTDAETGLPVEMANVQLLRGSGQKLVNYSLTDAKGSYLIQSANDVDSLHIAISLLGYEAVMFPAQAEKNVSIKLTPKVFSIREVEVRPGRVWGRQDTINYDVTQFISPKDNAIKDVIKKLPGVDVDELGRISYNGKNISNFYVEGMDVTDGRYNQINNNLDARAVEKIQVLENHQPIRILKDKIKTEDIAINLKLKDDFKDKWMITLQSGLGASSSSVLWDANLYALQLSRKNQSVYGYKSNNRGVDVTEEMAVMTTDAFNRTKEPSVTSFLSLPSLIAPLKKEKMLFNDVHTFAANRLYKLNETTKLRINAGYIHDERKQERGSQTTYYQQHDSIQIVEESNNRLRTDRGELAFTLENNADNRYLTNRFTTIGDWGRGYSNFTGNQSVSQRIRTTEMTAKNDLRSLWNREKYTYEFHSFTRYNHLPTELIVNDDRQRLHLNQFYTDNNFSLFRKIGLISHRYTGGFTGQLNNIENGYSAHATGNWQGTFNKWQTYLTLPLVWTDYFNMNFSRLAVNPSLSVIYKYNYSWRFSMHANYKESYGDITDFYHTPYRTNYRSTVINNGKMPVKRLQAYTLYGEYKNTVKEFFATLSLSHTRNWSDRIYEQVIEQDQVLMKSHKLSNQGLGWILNGTLSKSFYDWKMKTSLNYQLSFNEAEMLSEGIRLPYESSYLQLEPKVSWSPSRKWETSYEGNFRYGGSKVGDAELAPLWNIVQKLNLSYDLFPVEINLSGDHYYNDVSSDKGLHAFFLNAFLRWKSGTWQIDASINNIFDKRQYSYTQYSSLQSYTSWINIRGREFMISARYKF